MKQVKGLFFMILCICVTFSATTALFTSCKALPNDPIDTPEQTEESKAPEDLTTSPEETTDTEQETEPEEENTQPQKIELEPLDPTLLEQIEASAKAGAGYPIGYLYYYGTYNGGVVLRTAGNSYREFEQIVAGITIKHPENRNAVMWKGDKVYSLEDAYNQQLLTKDDIQTIANIANNHWYLTLKAAIKIEHLEKDELLQVAGSAQEYYYGCYNGYYALRTNTMFETERILEIDGVVFRFIDMSYIVLCKKGYDQLTLQEAYDQDILSKEDLQKIADIHLYKWYVSYNKDGVKF